MGPIGPPPGPIGPPPGGVQRLYWPPEANLYTTEAKKRQFSRNLAKIWKIRGKPPGNVKNRPKAPRFLPGNLLVGPKVGLQRPPGPIGPPPEAQSLFNRAKNCPSEAKNCPSEAKKPPQRQKSSNRRPIMAFRPIDPKKPLATVIESPYD